MILGLPAPRTHKERVRDCLLRHPAGLTAREVMAATGLLYEEAHGALNNWVRAGQIDRVGSYRVARFVWRVK